MKALHRKMEYTKKDSNITFRQEEQRERAET